MAGVTCGEYRKGEGRGRREGKGEGREEKGRTKGKGLERKGIEGKLRVKKRKGRED